VSALEALVDAALDRLEAEGEESISLRELAGERPVVACLAVLAGKDAAAMIAALAPAVTHLVATKLPTPADGPERRHIGAFQARRRGFGAEELARAAGGVEVEVEAIEDFATAVRRARDLARELDGVLLVTGSHYVLAPARAALGL